MALPPFELLDHTSEVGVLARGRDLRELFANAALALYSIMTPLEAIEVRGTRAVAAEAGDRESLLVAWLSELVFLFDTEGWLGKRASVQEVSDTAMEAAVEGEPADPSRHQLRLGVKAVTYHQLRVELTGAGWEAQYVVDV